MGARADVANLAMALFRRFCSVGHHFPNDIEAGLPGMDALRDPDEPDYDPAADGPGIFSGDNAVGRGPEALWKRPFESRVSQCGFIQGA